MAKVNYGPLINRIQGKLGSAVFSRTAGQDVVYEYKPPSVRTDPDSVRRRGLFRSANHLWNKLPALSLGTAPGLYAGKDLWRDAWNFRNYPGKSLSNKERFTQLYMKQVHLSGVGGLDVAGDPQTYVSQGTLTKVATNSTTWTITQTRWNRPSGYPFIATVIIILPYGDSGIIDVDAMLATGAYKFLISTSEPYTVAVTLPTGSYQAIGGTVVGRGGGVNSVYRPMWMYPSRLELTYPTG